MTIDQRKYRFSILFLRFLNENFIPLKCVISALIQGGIGNKNENTILRWRNLNVGFFACAFVWAKTIEGHEYWKQVDKKFREYCRKHHIKDNPYYE